MAGEPSSSKKRLKRSDFPLSDLGIHCASKAIPFVLEYVMNEKDTYTTVCKILNTKNTETQTDKIIHVINRIRKDKTENKYLLNCVPQIFLHSQNIDAITGTRMGWQWPLILPLFGFP